MAKEMTLKEIKDNLQRLREDIAKKEGEKAAELKSLEKEFKAKGLDDLYDLLKKLNVECDDLSLRRAELIEEADQLLKEFGY